MPTTSTSLSSARNNARGRMHLLLFVEQAVWFTVLLSLVQLAYHGYEPSMFWGIGATALIVAVVTSAILGRRQWRAALATRERRTADGEAAGPVDVSTHSTRTVEVAAAPSEILDHAADAATAVPRARVTSVDPGTGTIALSAPISWTSGGRRVRIAFAPKGSAPTTVTVSSGPAPASFILGGNVVDYGQNAQAVDGIVAWLRGLPTER